MHILSTISSFLSIYNHFVLFIINLNFNNQFTSIFKIFAIRQISLIPSTSYVQIIMFIYEKAKAVHMPLECDYSSFEIRFFFKSVILLRNYVIFYKKRQFCGFFRSFSYLSNYSTFIEKLT